MLVLTVVALFLDDDDSGATDVDVVDTTDTDDDMVDDETIVVVVFVVVVVVIVDGNRGWGMMMTGEFGWDVCLIILEDGNGDGDGGGFVSFVFMYESLLFRLLLQLFMCVLFVFKFN